MCGITFRRTDENLRPVLLKKLFFEILSGFLQFLLLSSQKYSLYLFRNENYRTNFKNVNLNLILLKSAPKDLAKKTVLPIEKSVFGQNFFVCTFY
jgi:hypothetical protein